MGHPFGHPSGKAVLKRVADVLQEKPVFLKADRKLVFVCGGATSRPRKYARSRFLRYARRELHDFRVLLAEVAFKDLSEHDQPSFLNLAEFEELIADIADCILMFPESPGSFAELGFFSANQDARKKLLIANNIDKQGDSFINNGPIAFVNESSTFRATVYLDFSNKPNDFKAVVERIRNRLTTKQRLRLKPDEYCDLQAKIRLYATHEMLRLFSALSVDGLTHVANTLFGGADKEVVRRMVAILVAVGYAKRVGNEKNYFAPADDKKAFIEIDNFDAETLRSDVLQFYQKHSQGTLEVLRGKS
jgi:hypothetical protein